MLQSDVIMLDLQTTIIFSLLVHLALAAVMVMAYTTRKVYPGFRSWTISLVCWALGSASLALRPLTGVLPSVLLSNAFYFVCPILLYSGTARFYGFDRTGTATRSNLVFAAMMYCVVLAFYFVENNLNMRIFFNSLCMSVLCVRTGLAPMRYARGRYLPLQAVVSGCNIILSGFMLTRGIVAAMQPPMSTFAYQDPVIVPLLVASIFCLVLMGFGLVSLTSCRLEEELLQTQEQLRLQAQHDGLTGMCNRRHFTELASRATQEARRYGKQLSVILFDMDGFKTINDTFGHAVGDDVLRAAAEACRKVLRQADVAARWGGEEFAVLLPQTGLAGAMETAERLREGLEALRTGQAGELPATASFGVATLTGDEDMEGLLLRADAYLYEAKRDGRNRVKAQTSGRD